MKIQPSLERGTAYDELAHEYYNSRLHPTSANFRLASKNLLHDQLDELTAEGFALEVGCGMSVVAELLMQNQRPLSGLMLLDSSETMLHYSLPYQQRGARLLAGDAAQLPFEANTFAVITSVLGDPYNHASFWAEISRTLRPRGIAFFTTPSFQWSEAFRTLETSHVAEFELSDGQILRVPSLIYPLAEQTRLIETAGLRVQEVVDTPLHSLREQAVSKKLSYCLTLHDPVVTAFVVTKP